jgi:hypothetical protein
MDKKPIFLFMNTKQQRSTGRTANCTNNWYQSGKNFPLSGGRRCLLIFLLPVIMLLIFIPCLYKFFSKNPYPCPEFLQLIILVAASYRLV